MTTTKTKKPKTIKLRKDRAKGVEAELFINPGQEIAEGWFWTYNPNELRKLAKWCEEAAKFLEGCPSIHE